MRGKTSEVIIFTLIYFLLLSRSVLASELFYESIEFPVGHYPRSVAMGDLNRGWSHGSRYDEQGWR